MKTVQMLYQDREVFVNSLTAAEFNCNTACPVRIYPVICNKDDALCIAKEIKNLLPNTQIMGGSGILFEEKESDDQALVRIEVLRDAIISVNTYGFYNKEAVRLVRKRPEAFVGKPFLSCTCYAVTAILMFIFLWRNSIRQRPY